MTGVTACLIVRDEEAMLPDCLASLAPWVDELCVLDTGSKDSTAAIARAHGAKLAHYVWSEDFSAARNACLQLATQRWILSVDADERLDPNTGPMLREVVRCSTELAHLVLLDDLGAGGKVERAALLRLFRNLPEIRFERPVHESVLGSLRALGVHSPSTTRVRLEHLGYRPDVLKAKNKHQRNLDILRRRYREAPTDLYNAYKLAVTLADTALDEKLEVFTTAQKLLASDQARAELTFADKLCDAHAACLMQAGRLGEAREVLLAAVDHEPDSAALLQRLGELLRRLGHLEAARETLLRALAPRPAAWERADDRHAVAVRTWVSLYALEQDGACGPLPDRGAPALDVAVRCAALRAELWAGKAAEVADGLAPLLGSDFARDDVKLLAGELSWALGDFTTAEAMWRLTAQHTDAGHVAHRWLALLAHQQKRRPTVEAPVRDVDDVALRQLLGGASVPAQAFDAAFEREPVEVARQRLLRWLAAAPSSARKLG